MPRMRVLIWLVWLCHFCSAQSVTVRVLNGNDEHPLQKQSVSVQFLYEKPPKASPSLHIETDADGQATFNIPEPIPEHIDVRVTLTSEHWHCACGVMADTQQILRNGILQAAPSKEPNASGASAGARPGQIVFLARPFTFFERVLYPFVKQ
jgi:hypothetical protein